MNQEDVTNAVIRWVSSATDDVVIKGYQSNPRPPLPYAMVHFQAIGAVRDNVSSICYDELETLNSEGFNQIQLNQHSLIEWSFNINSYGDQSSDLLYNLYGLYQSNRFIDENNTLALYDFSEIRHIPEQIKNKWESRSNCSILIRGYNAFSLNIDTIEKTSFNIERV